MKTSLHASLIPALIVLGIGANVATAQPVPIAQSSSHPASSTNTSSVPYASGGVGYDERDRMEAAKSQFNLRLMFAVTGGEYLSGVKVHIQDTAGATLLDATSNGPWFYAQLPSGNYVLTLDNRGKIKTRNVNISAQGATIENFYWVEPVSAVPAQGTTEWAIRPASPQEPRLYSSDIPYISGGNGANEYDRMEAAKGQYNLRLVFSVDNADYQPNSVRVRVQEKASQRVLVDTDAKGPLFYARVPQGQYLVTLDYDGQQYHEEMGVPENGSATESFNWTH
ncbi:MAG: hypothetical protein WAT23_01050 [Chromatiaceae bacterium]